MPRRTVEDVERQVALLEEQNHRLRSNCSIAETALREQKAQHEERGLALKLLRIASDISDTADVNALYRRLLGTLAEELGAGGAVLWLANPRGTLFEARAAYGRIAPVVREEPLEILAEMQPSDVRRACEALMGLSTSPQRGGAQNMPAAIAEFDLHSDHAGAGEEKKRLEDRPEERPLMLAAILRNSAGILGGIGLCHPARGTFPPGAQAAFGAVAGDISHAVASLAHRERQQRNLREISVLYEVSGLTHVEGDSERAWEALIDLIARVVPFENCTFFVNDGDSGRLIPRATRGRLVNLIDHVSFRDGAGIAGWVAGQRKLLAIQDLLKETALLDAELVPPRVRSLVSVPLVADGRVLGVVNVSHSQPNAFSAEDAHILSMLAGQAAMALEQGAKLRSLGRMAITDPLTGLYNRRFFDLTLDNEIKRGRRYGQPVSLMMIDIDHFKRINDLHGHGAGDRALQDLADLLRRTVRESEVVARCGGEEFGVILPQTSPAEAQIAAERLRRNVEEAEFHAPDGSAFHITFSAGIAGFPRHSEERAGLALRADQALYAAKEAGRNCVRAAA